MNVLLWVLAVAVLLSGALTAGVVLHRGSYNYFDTRLVLRAATVFASGALGACAIGLRASPPGSALEITMLVMTFVGPILVFTYTLILCTTSFRRALWTAFKNGRQLPPGVPEESVIAWGKRHERP